MRDALIWAIILIVLAIVIGLSIPYLASLVQLGANDTGRVVCMGDACANG